MSERTWLASTSSVRVVAGRVPQRELPAADRDGRE